MFWISFLLRRKYCLFLKRPSMAACRLCQRAQQLRLVVRNVNRRSDLKIFCLGMYSDFDTEADIYKPLEESIFLHDLDGLLDLGTLWP